MKPSILFQTETWAFGCAEGERYFISRTPFEWQIYIPLGIGRMLERIEMDSTYDSFTNVLTVVWEQHVLLSKKVFPSSVPFRDTPPGLACD